MYSRRRPIGMMTLGSDQVSNGTYFAIGLADLQQAHGERKHNHSFQPELHAQRPNQQQRYAEDEDFECHGCELDAFPQTPLFLVSKPHIDNWIVRFTISIQC